MENSFKTQSGRSMVEMLGTLAIIGVLSIGGIMGYSYAVDKHRANEILNDVNLRAIDLIAQVNRGGDLSLAEWPTTTGSDYNIGLETNSATNTTEGGIFVDKVPHRICEIIADDLLPTGILLSIDGEDYVSGSCGETNKMVFFYDAVTGDTSGGSTENGEENTPSEKECEGIMVNDICTPCPSNTTLSSNKQECLCSDGGPFDFETNECLTSCEQAFYDVFQIGSRRGDLVTANGSTVTLDVPSDGTETTFTVISNASASHCTLNIASGQSIFLDFNGRSLETKAFSVDGILTMTDSSDEQDGRMLNNNIDILGVMTINSGTIDADKISVAAGGMNISGGYIEGNITASGSVFLNMTGGTVKGNITASDESTFNMSYGYIEGNMTLSSPNVSITGGMFTLNTFSISGDAFVYLSGGEFDIGTLTCSDTSGIEGYWPPEYFKVTNMRCDNVSNDWD